MDINKTLTIMYMHIICFLFSVTSLILGLALLPKLTIYYIVLLVPMLILFSILAISFNIKIVLTIIELIFGQNDNDEVSFKLNNYRERLNLIVEYSLIILLVIIMIVIIILNIILCIKKAKYILLIISITLWLFLIYSLLKLILK